MIGLLLLTAFLIFANGFFVAAEFALVKVRSTQLEVHADQGQRLAGVARSLLDHLDGYLSATQLGITLTSLGLGWIGEPAVAALLSPLFHALHVPEHHAHRISVVVGFTIISFLHIVVGEVAPKSLAIARPVGVSMAVALPMRVFHGLFYPFLIVLNASSNLLLRLVGIEPAGTHSLAIPGDELVRMAEESAAGGHISAREGEMVSNVFAFTHRVAREIMVPRLRVQAMDLAAPIADQISLALEHGHSRYPVYERDLDHVVGVLHLKDLLRHDISALTPELLRTMIRPPLLVPESLPAEKLMRTMQRRHTHLAMVVDEYGGVSGVVSLEDALEELVGEILDEYDEEPDPIHRVDGGFRLIGAAPLHAVAQALEVPLPQTDSDTLQGWLMEQLERLPTPGDEVAFGEYTVRIVEVFERTITRAEAQKNVAEAEEGGEEGAE